MDSAPVTDEAPVARAAFVAPDGNGQGRGEASPRANQVSRRRWRDQAERQRAYLRRRRGVSETLPPQPNTHGRRRLNEAPAPRRGQLNYRWRIRTRLPERFGAACRVTARGRLNSIRVEFADGFWCITSRWSVRTANL
jgi:hypothetical protein